MLTKAILSLCCIISAVTCASVPEAYLGPKPQDSGSPTIQGPAPSQTFPFHDQLTDDYTLYWDFNKTHITFEVVVKTNGWVGFGISPKGAMANSDVVIGWVSGGQVHFSDRHAEGHYLPAQDAHQDWTLLLGDEVGEYTRLKMVRQLDTCDDQDVPLMIGTSRVIYAYGSADPPSDNAVSYHGNTRGTKSLLLLDPPTNMKDENALPSDVRALEFKNGDYHVPSTDTTYHCTFWKLPNLGGKHHMIKYEPIIQTGHELLLHHILLYYCSGTIPEPTTEPTAVTCYHHSKAHDCQNVLVAWAIGGKAFNYPAHAGFSLGGAGDPGYFMMETHYDNPNMRRDFVDDSGIRLYITKQLRQYDAGVLTTGVQVDDYQIIPPYEPSFMSTGVCGETCLGEALGDQTINIFANLLHAHLIGTKLRTRHIRNGTELALLQEDNSYDFDYQETRMLEQERVVKKGDTLIVECEYDSTQRTSITWGGLSSREEMCLSFLVYYPRLQLTKCESRVNYNIPPQYAGKRPQQIVNNLDWTQPGTHSGFKQSMEDASYIQSCRGSGHHFNANHKTTKPKVTKPYVKPAGQCPSV